MENTVYTDKPQSTGENRMSDRMTVDYKPTTSAIEALRKWQILCDPEGIEVKVSRQALDEVLDRITVLTAQLEAVKPLPDKWRDEKVHNPTDTGKSRNFWIDTCADELTAALQGKC